MKRLFIDIETTGLSPNKNSIVEVSGIVDIGGNIEKEFTVYIKPEVGEKFDQNALKVIGKTPTELIARGEEIPIAKKRLESIWEEFVNKFDKKDKFFFYAYNSPFDYRFLRRFWERQDDKYFRSWFWFPDICIMRLAAEDFMGFQRPKDFKLASVARFLEVGVNEGELHTGICDVRTAREIYYKMKGGDFDVRE